MTLTKDQRRYRKDKKDGQRHFRRTVREDGSTGVRVTHQKLCVRVNEEAYDRLKTESSQRNMSMGELLSRMLCLGIPNYGGTREMGIAGYPGWKEHLKRPEDFKKKYKGKGGSKMLTLKVTTTAWKKLEMHHYKEGRSKARLVQDLILNWTFTPQHVLDKMKERIAENRALYGDRNNPNPQRRAIGPREGSDEWWMTATIEEIDKYEEEERVRLTQLCDRHWNPQ